MATRRRRKRRDRSTYSFYAKYRSQAGVLGSVGPFGTRRTAVKYAKKLATAAQARDRRHGWADWCVMDLSIRLTGNKGVWHTVVAQGTVRRKRKGPSK